MAEPAGPGGIDPDRQALLDVLTRHRVAFVLIGGAAIQSHGLRYDTQDIDITPDAEPENLSRLAGALNELDCRLVTDPADTESWVALPSDYFTPRSLCRERLDGDTRIEYVLSSGSDLLGVEDGSIEAVWSFDVFVHVAPGDQAAYLGEIARVLAPGGTAVLHHSDGRNRGELPSRSGWRSPMSRRLFAALAAERGLQVECQFDSWGADGRHDLSAYGDAITVCKC